MQKTCVQCQASFEFTEPEQQLWQSLALTIGGNNYPFPLPDKCPDCRMKQRLCFRNQSSLYNRPCSKTGEVITSAYRPDSNAAVYNNDLWWGDDFDPKEYGRDYDFTRPFFEQFKELHDDVPVVATLVALTENCQYNMYVGDSKDCYLCSSTGSSSDVYYSHNIINCHDIVDCAYLYDCQMCYDCLHCNRANHCVSCRNCENIHDCYYMVDCQNCHDCIACVGLIGKQYCVDNTQLTEEEYQQHLVKLQSSQRQEHQRYALQLHQLLGDYLFRATTITASENCNGDHLLNCNNVHQSYVMRDVENAWHCFECEDSHSHYGSVYGHISQRCLEVMDSWMAYNVAFSCIVGQSHDVTYSDCIFNNCSNLFGCVALKQSHYCILNKQYTKEQYEELMPRIIKHMQSTGEWGQYFLPEISHFDYNETVAQDFYPLTKQEALAQGFTWYDEPEDIIEEGTAIPDTIDEVPDMVTDHVLKSQLSGKGYKVLPKELWFYRKMRLPLPILTPKERFNERSTKLHERKLYARNCHQCKAEVQTPHAEASGKKILCETCYLGEKY